MLLASLICMILFLSCIVPVARTGSLSFISAQSAQSLRSCMVSEAQCPRRNAEAQCLKRNVQDAMLGVCMKIKCKKHGRLIMNQPCFFITISCASVTAYRYKHMYNISSLIEKWCPGCYRPIIDQTGFRQLPCVTINPHICDLFFG